MLQTQVPNPLSYEFEGQLVAPEGLGWTWAGADELEELEDELEPEVDEPDELEVLEVELADDEFEGVEAEEDEELEPVEVEDVEEPVGLMITGIAAEATTNAVQCPLI